MRGHFLVIAILLSLSRISVSHFFFPNITIPPELLPNITKTAWDSFNNLTGCHSGDKTDGLSKLKKYFKEFGYIDNNSSSSNFTDDFDDALEQAIKTYQHNFNLNVTGELDDATLKQIVRPRCGNADVINGTSSMNSGESPSSSKSHFHTVGHYTFFPNTPKWPENKYSLTYGFHPDNQLSDTVKAVFTRAFARWSEVTPLTFTMTDSYTAADIRIAFFSGDHGDGEPFDGVLGTLAHAFSPTSGRFHLDSAESWVVEGDVTTSSLSNAIDLESVAVHEIGHLLGLGHSSVEEAIMYPTISVGTRKLALATDDVNGVQYLYGSNPNYNGSTATTSIQETTPGSGVNGLGPALWGLRLLLAVGFVLMFV